MLLEEGRFVDAFALSLKTRALALPCVGMIHFHI